MKKLLFVAIAIIASISFLVSCGQSEEEKAMAQAVYEKYTEYDYMKEIKVNILDLEAKETVSENDTSSTPDLTEEGSYYVKFKVLEEYPNRRVHYDGWGRVVKRNGRYECTNYDTKETYSRFLNE